MNQHHHHSPALTVTAALVGGAAAIVAYLVGREQTTKLVGELHEELHANVARGDQATAETRAVMGHNFMNTAAGQQHLAEAVNALTDRLNETLAFIMPNRAQPGGEEPPA